LVQIFILLITPLSKHPQSMFLIIRDQVPHPYKTTGKIINLHILILKYLDRRRETKIPNWMVASTPRI
jgi:hypothetical protein